ncbi:hypothetical protein FSP39_007531 [Pinctada imbricata]|uniref:Flavin-containing monooxygenase n=1 Tax=Pinctada imbricata TaxID=66713 RepID=A0AA88XKR3_PINIB|nr:hypothetical protein FSP39_007531 [Pinctada imbricata]
MELFQGRIMHSRNYRHAELFEGLDLAVLGANFSGQEISMQIAKCAKKVYVCHERINFPPSFPKDIEQHPPFVRMTKNSVIFPNGSEIKVDAVVFYPGYRYSYPFLKNGIINIEDERITPIYKHMIHIDYPSLIFFNIARQMLYFLHFDVFARVAVRILDGRVRLPSKDAMLKDSDDDFQLRLKDGLKSTYAHHMGHGERQWDFNADLARMGGFNPLPPVLRKLWYHIIDQKYTNIMRYTEVDYEITGENSYKNLDSE